MGKKKRFRDMSGMNIYFDAQRIERVALLCEGRMVVFALHDVQEIEKAEDTFSVDIRAIAPNYEEVIE